MTPDLTDSTYVQTVTQAFVRIWQGVLEWLPEITIGLVVFGFFYLLSRGVRAGIRRFFIRRSRARNLGLVLGRLTQLFLISIGLFSAMAVIFPSVRVASIINFLGISSVAIGFAFKDILQNFLAGILILLNAPFRLGDQIQFGPFEGTIEDIQTRATFIRTYDGRRIVIPNAELFTKSVTVNTAFDSRRSETVIGIGMSVDVNVARSTALNLVRSVDGVAHDPPPDVIAQEIGSTTLNLEVRWWTKPEIANVLSVQDRVIDTLKSGLLAKGIDLPYTTQKIILERNVDRDVVKDS